MMRINENGMDIIRDFEGFSRTAYLCPGGVWTIGYGHTRNVKQGDTCTPAQAERWLFDDVERAEDIVHNRARVILTHNQFSALVSWAFNVGDRANATLWTRVNMSRHDEVPVELRRWVNAAGRRLNGLVRRREAEAELYMTPDGAIEECLYPFREQNPPVPDDPDEPVGFWTHLIHFLWRIGAKEDL